MALLGDRVFKEITKLRLLVGALVQYDRGPLTKGKFRHRRTQGEQDMKTISEIRVMLPQAKEPHNASKAPEVRGKIWDRLSTSVMRTNVSRHLDLSCWPPAPMRFVV